MRIISCIVILSFFLGVQLYAHSGKPRHHVVIDTDGALDDMRSLTMFLSGNDIRILAITCSQGTLLPDSAFLKVKSLLSSLHHEGIRVGTGTETGQPLPVWSSFAQAVRWGAEQRTGQTAPLPDAIRVLTEATMNYRDKITLVALGSLRTYADWIRSDPEAAGKIERIFWCSNPDREESFNYRACPESYDYITLTGIELIVVTNGSDQLYVDRSYLDFMKNSNSQYARQIETVHARDRVAAQMQKHPLYLWDDLVPLYLTVPLLFDRYREGEIRYVSLKKGLPGSFIYETITKLLESASATNNRVFKSFPVDTSLYKAGYVQILEPAISSFGAMEWKAVCMTNEIHGHTGIYSIIGAKMGIRAMEYFNVGVNNLSVTSFVGHTPPLSCFNDGIQISTGATIGQGLITVMDEIIHNPTVIFEFNNRKVKMSLREEVADQIRKDLVYGVNTYGNLTDQYWLYIEELAIRYWGGYNRWEIFDISGG